jgi:hypothetical protein
MGCDGVWAGLATSKSEFRFQVIRFDYFRWGSVGSGFGSNLVILFTCPLFVRSGADLTVLLVKHERGDLDSALLESSCACRFRA